MVIFSYKYNANLANKVCGRTMDRYLCEYKLSKKAFSQIGWALSVILLVSSLLQGIWIAVPEMIWGEENWFATSPWGKWIGSFAPIYLIGIPLGLLILKKLPADAPESGKLGGKNFMIFLLIAFCLMYSGNIIGTLLSAILSGGAADNPLTDYAMDTSPLKIVVMVILAPLIEEYVFRKQIIDRTKQYGEKLAVFLSALTFGLFHLNLFQFFYAFALGGLFAYIYLRTGRLRYPVLLHGIVNFLGSVVAPFMLSLVDMEALTQMDPNATAEQIIEQYGHMLPGLLVLMLYAMVLVGLAITGLVLLILKCRKLIWKEADFQLPKEVGIKTAYLNVGMIVYVLLCVSMIVLSLV